jgi:hypothetical protein
MEEVSQMTIKKFSNELNVNTQTVRLKLAQNLNMKSVKWY